MTNQEKIINKFINYCLKRENYKFCDRLSTLLYDYLDEQEQKKRYKGCNQNCFYNCLNEEYIYPEPETIPEEETNEPEYPLCKYCLLREYDSTTDKFLCGEEFDQEVYCKEFIIDPETLTGTTLLIVGDLI